MSNARDEVVWVIQTEPPVAGDARWNARVIERVRPELLKQLRQTPTTTEVNLEGVLLSVNLRRQSGIWREGTAVRIVMANSRPSTTGTAGTGSGSTGIALPNAEVTALAERMLGLETIQEMVLLWLGCQWDGQLETWSRRTGSTLSPAMRAPLAERVPLFILAGDPGTGKSATARTVADRYCRSAGVTGRFLWLGTETRGNGLVGGFGNRVRAAFDAAVRSAITEPTFVLLDEADALAMRRSETSAHQEDRAGTATLLQVLDAIPQGARLAVFLTTNLLEKVDPAVRRRGVSYVFPRPDEDTRRELIARWLPRQDRRGLLRAARASAGMTPADIERALTSCLLEAVRTNGPLTTRLAVKYLSAGERAGEV